MGMLDDSPREKNADLTAFVDDKGIWMPDAFFPCHKLVMTKEVFVAAYKRYILEEKE